jgi:hypothetical protein
MNCPAQIFTGITPAAFDALAARAKASTGVDVAGATGKASAKGYTLEWQYDIVAETLMLQCLSAPWPISLVPGTINDRIAAMVNTR